MQAAPAGRPPAAEDELEPAWTDPDELDVEPTVTVPEDELELAGPDPGPDEFEVATDDPDDALPPVPFTFTQKLLRHVRPALHVPFGKHGPRSSPVADPPLHAPSHSAATQNNSAATQNATREGARSKRSPIVMSLSSSVALTQFVEAGYATHIIFAPEKARWRNLAPLQDPLSGPTSPRTPAARLSCREQ
jgi:hypothetical protein